MTVVAKAKRNAIIRYQPGVRKLKFSKMGYLYDLAKIVAIALFVGLSLERLTNILEFVLASSSIFDS